MNINAKNLELTDAIQGYIEKKIGGALSGRVIDVIHVDIQIERTTEHHQKGDVFRVAVNAEIPRGQIYTQEVGADMYAVIDLAAGDVTRQVHDMKEKQQTRQRVARKSARSLKSI